MKNIEKLSKYVSEMQEDICSVTDVHLERLKNDDDVNGAEFASIVMTVFSSLTIRFSYLFKIDKAYFLKSFENSYDIDVQQMEEDDDE